MLDFGFYNMDCLEGMKHFPDKYFDLAVVDPPYGINIGGVVGGADSSVARKPMIIGGENISTPKHTRRSTTVPRRTPHILTNWNALRKQGLYGGGTTSLTILAQQSA